MSLYQDIQRTYAELEIAHKEAKEYGELWAAANAKYETVKSLRFLELRDEGMAVAVIKEVIKGMPDVNDAMHQRDVAKVQYDNASEGINVLKKQYDFLREQYQREWNQSGWSER